MYNIKATKIWRVVRAGRRSTIGNRVTAINRSRVRIPCSPPFYKGFQGIESPSFFAQNIRKLPSRRRFADGYRHRSAPGGRKSEVRMAQWSKVVGAPSRKQLSGTTRGKVYLFIGVWCQAESRESEKAPVSLLLRWIIKLQGIV